MANAMTFDSAKTLLNAIAQQVTGDTALTAVDTTSFVSVAQTLLQTGTDSLSQGISVVLDKTLFAARPYDAAFPSMMRSASEFGAWDRKINYCDRDFLDDPSYTLTDGSTYDPWAVRKPVTVQCNFTGVETVMDCITRYLDQMKQAFRGPEEFGEFFSGALVELSNKHEQKTENIARLTLINLVLGIIGAAGANSSPQVVKLLTEYNAATGGSYTKQQIMSAANYTPFMRWVYARIMTVSDLMRSRTGVYHMQITGKHINRHTPREKQLLYMYAPELRQMEARALSETFHDDLIRFKSVERVNYWQSVDSGDSMKGKPVYMGADGTLTNAQAAITQADILGVLCDYEALGVRPYSEGMYSSPLNPVGKYYNHYYHWAWRSYNDFTENAVVFLLA